MGMANRQNRQLHIEDILSHDLWDEFKALRPGQQQRFKARGERVVRELDRLLGRRRCSERRVFKKIYRWLKTLKHIDRFSLTGAAAIKTKRIFHLK